MAYGGRGVTGLQLAAFRARVKRRVVLRGIPGCAESSERRGGRVVRFHGAIRG